MFRDDLLRPVRVRTVRQLQPYPQSCRLGMERTHRRRELDASLLVVATFAVEIAVIANLT